MSENGKDTQEIYQGGGVKVYPLALPQSSFEHSPSIGKLVEALSKAGAEFKPAFKDAINPTYRAGARYVPLENLIEATRGSLSKHGLAVMQLPSVSETNVRLTTLLAHSSGEWISSSLQLPGDQRGRFDAQSVGSGVTYARRYAYQSILNIAGEVDDDGNAAAGVGSKEAAQNVAKQKLADYAEKSTASVKDKLLDIFSAKLGDLPIIVFVRSEAMALLVEHGLADFTTFNDGLKARYFADTLTNKELLGNLCKDHSIRIRTINQPGLNNSAKSNANVIKSAAEMPTKTGKKRLKVMFGNDDVVTEMSCWVQDLWDEIVANIGNPAEFIIKEKGQYRNIEGITSMNGRTYSQMKDGSTRPDIQRTFTATDEDLPDSMRG